LIYILHPDVSQAFKWLKECDLAPVGRDLCAGDLRIAKEEFSVYDWRGLAAAQRQQEKQDCQTE
jgi:hypothetical protein